MVTVRLTLEEPPDCLQGGCTIFHPTSNVMSVAASPYPLRHHHLPLVLAVLPVKGHRAVTVAVACGSLMADDAGPLFNGLWVVYSSSLEMQIVASCVCMVCIYTFIFDLVVASGSCILLLLGNSPLLLPPFP